MYSDDNTVYEQKTVSQRIESLFLNNLGKVVTRQQIIRAATDPKTGKQPENWHQRLSELRTDKGYTILSWRDRRDLAPQEYIMPNAERRPNAAKRVLPTTECWKLVLNRANFACEWQEDGQHCGLVEGDIDPIGGGTVKLTPDHMTPHSVNPVIDVNDPNRWQALCGRHQVMKKNYWDSTNGKINVVGILQSVNEKQKKDALEFLLNFYGLKIQEDYSPHK
ncbi:restriction endonuclease [Escherichia coli]|uniref:restriction endonuclease n=1 Tax=Escherichia coli TaxID=562 RepID=UPI0030C668AD